MLKKTLNLLLILLLLIPSQVLANTKKISNLKKGDPAPFTGILLTPSAFFDLENKVVNEKIICNLEKDFLAKRKDLDLGKKIELCQIDLKFTKKELEERLKIVKDRQKLLENRVLKQKWEPIIWLTVGLLAGAGISIGIYYVANQNSIQK